jgi:hypothetical protein
MTAVLRGGALCRSDLLDAVGLEKWLDADSSSSNHLFKLWLLFVLEHWARIWLLAEAEAA